MKNSYLCYSLCIMQIFYKLPLFQLFGNVANINSLFVPHKAPIKLSEGSGIDMIRLRKTMSQLRTVKHPDYHKAISEILEHNVIPHLPSNVGYLYRISYNGTRVMIL